MKRTIAMASRTSNSAARYAQAPIVPLTVAGTAFAFRDLGTRVGATSWPLKLKGFLTLRDLKFYRFFTSNAEGRQAAQVYLSRLKERKVARDKGLTPAGFLRHLKATKAWDRQAPQDLARIVIPGLIANGDHDATVPTQKSIDIARRIPGAQLVIYEDVGHGGIFQYHGAFVSRALSFLSTPDTTLNWKIGASP